jgi:hypothetical protein
MSLTSGETEGSPEPSNFAKGDCVNQKPRKLKTSSSATTPSLLKSAKQQPVMELPEQELVNMIACMPGASIQSAAVTAVRQVVPRQQAVARSSSGHGGVGGQVTWPGCTMPVQAVGRTRTHVPSLRQQAVATAGQGLGMHESRPDVHVPEASRQGSCGVTLQSPLVQQAAMVQTVAVQVVPTAANWPVQRDAAVTVQPVSVQQAPVAKTHGEVVQVAPSAKTPPAATQETLEVLAQVPTPAAI